MHLNIILLLFGVIFLAELPDKSLFAALILGSRYPGFYVWLGAATAFLIHVIIAVTAGRLLTLLPQNILEGVIAALFLLGACLVLFGKHGLEEEHSVKKPAQHSPGKVFATAFSVVFIGEWGDITQIATANYAAKYHDTVNVAIGATLGLWLAAALAIVLGKRALKLIPGRLLQLITGFVLLGFGLFSAYSALR